MNMTKQEIEEIGKKIEKLSQVHDLASIETILVTILFAILVLGITLFLTVEDSLWKIVSLSLIMFTFFPITAFLCSFLSKVSKRVKTLKITILLISLYLIYIGIMFFILLLISLGTFDDIIKILDIYDVRPILFAFVIEVFFIYDYFWWNHFEPNLDKRFYLLMEKQKIEEKESLFRKGVIPTYSLFFLILIACSIFLGELSQLLILISLVIGTSLFIKFKFKTIEQKGRTSQKKINPWKNDSRFVRYNKK